MRALLLALALPLAACGADTAPASDPPPAVAPAEVEAERAVMMEEDMPEEAMDDDMSDMGTPTVVAEGTFSGAEGHDVEGRAVLYRLEDGSHTVRLEGLDSDNGPDLEVWLVTSLSDKPAGHVNLGALRSTRGNQNYPVPAGADVSGAQGVTIWCEAFSVEFGTARLD